MNVYVDPLPTTLSRAMFRVARALRMFAPDYVKIVDRVEEADLQILHVIGYDSMKAWRSPRCVIIQYCFNTSDTEKNAWQQYWDKADLVWSYYDLQPFMTGGRFYRSPLGVDEVFTPANVIIPRDIGVLTTGYVSGPGAEAIEDVAIAASLAGLNVMHVGGYPVGMGPAPRGFSRVEGIADSKLRDLYRRSRWVAALRYVEGFEMPAIEGLACGARPIVFDRPDMHAWYDGLATFVPECHGLELRQHLLNVFKEYDSVTEGEQELARTRFDWKTIITDFWSSVLYANGVNV